MYIHYKVCCFCLYNVLYDTMYVKVAETLAQSEGVSKLLVAQHDAFKGYLPGANMKYL